MKRDKLFCKVKTKETIFVNIKSKKKLKYDF